jgi:hypothetical protein
VHWKHQKLLEEMKLRKAPVALELPADVQANQHSLQEIKQTAMGATTLSKFVSQLERQPAPPSDSTLFDTKIKQPTPSGESQDDGGSSGDKIPIGLVSGQTASESYSFTY